MLESRFDLTSVLRTAGRARMRRCYASRLRDIAYVCETDEVDHHIGDLVHDALAQPVIPGDGVSFDVGVPLQLRHEFADLAGECHEQVLRGVEPLPVA